MALILENLFLSYTIFFIEVHNNKKLLKERKVGTC